MARLRSYRFLEPVSGEEQAFRLECEYRELVHRLEEQRKREQAAKEQAERERGRTSNLDRLVAEALAKARR